MFSKVIFHLKIGSRFYKLRRVNNCVKCRAMQFVCKVCCHKVLMFCLWRSASGQKLNGLFIRELLKSRYHENCASWIIYSSCICTIYQLVQNDTIQDRFTWQHIILKVKISVLWRKMVKSLFPEGNKNRAQNEIFEKIKHSVPCLSSVLTLLFLG